MRTGLTLGLFLCTTTAWGLVVRSYDPGRHDRFSSGYPDSPVVNTNGYVDYYDFSGVGWHDANPARSLTLISPRHFVGATHFPPGVGATITFHARDAQLREYTVAAQHVLTNAAGQNVDLFVGELETAVTPCDHISFYPVLDLPSEADYQGEPIILYGRSARAGSGTIGDFEDFPGEGSIGTTRTCRIHYMNAAGDGDDCHVESGDSGSPTFAMRDGTLFVVGTHSSVSSEPAVTISSDTFVPHYADQIRAILLADGYPLATNAMMAFRPCLTVEPVAPDAFSISWVGHRNRVYRLLAGTQLPSFSALSPPLTSPVGQTTYVDSNATSRVRFYRLERLD